MPKIKQTNKQTNKKTKNPPHLVQRLLSVSSSRCPAPAQTPVCSPVDSPPPLPTPRPAGSRREGLWSLTALRAPQPRKVEPPCCRPGLGGELLTAKGGEQSPALRKPSVKASHACFISPAPHTDRTLPPSEGSPKPPGNAQCSLAQRTFEHGFNLGHHRLHTCLPVGRVVAVSSVLLLHPPLLGGTSR